MHLGAAWYPEHWPESRWPEDVRLMREAGFTVVRLAEFAWSALEATEGQYTFDWLDRAIDLLHDNGIAVVLGTPTAAPPSWLTYHHPDTLAVLENGRAAQHGNRCHASPVSTTYQRYVRRIVEQLARRFGQDERVIGWQIDNEYSRIDYSDSARRLFQSYLKDQYGALEALNSHWTTAYWSQTYSEWREIPLPIGPHNPGLMLSFRRFITKIWQDFQKTQIESLRMYIRPEQWITHNFMGWFDGFDHYDVAADLNLVSWDWYVGRGHNDYLRSGATHDLTRGLKRQGFWVMETQPGHVNWAGVNTTLNKGEGRAMAWHAVAHGADAVLYWQWRSALGGQEQLHGTLVAPDGNPRPFYDEVRRIGRDFASVGPALDGTSVRSETAILHSYESRWSIDAQRHHEGFSPVDLLQHYYRPLAARNISVDILSAESELTGYRLVIAPALLVLSEATVRNLAAFVEGGGTLVLTVRCGQKDRHNALFPALQPGPLRELAGAEVEEYYALDEPAPIAASWRQSLAGETRIWAERLRPLDETTETLARFGESNGWLDGGSAVTSHLVGEGGGRVVTVGAILNEALQDDLMAWLAETSHVSANLAGAPSGIEVARRVAEDGREVVIVINHTSSDTSLSLPAAPLGAAATDALSGEEFHNTLPLPPYGVRVFHVGGGG